MQQFPFPLASGTSERQSTVNPTEITQDQEGFLAEIIAKSDMHWWGVIEIVNYSWCGWGLRTNDGLCIFPLMTDSVYVR